MSTEFEFMGLYFSSIVPRFLICLAVWYPLYQLCHSVGVQRLFYFPTLFNLTLFLGLLATSTFI